MLGQIQQHALASSLYSFLPLYWNFFPSLHFGVDLLTLAEPNVCCYNLAILSLSASAAFICFLVSACHIFHILITEEQVECNRAFSLCLFWGFFAGRR